MSFKPLSNAFQKTLKTLLKKKNYTAEDITQYTDLVGAIYDTLQKAITPEIAQQIPTQLTQALDDNIFLFSGLKTHAQLTEASKLLRDTNGNIKSQEQFTREFTQLYGKYNQQYLRAEYAFAQQSVLSASRWSQFDDDDDFMLQYRTAGDERVRSAHQSLHNTTLPKNDPFWQAFTPPNGWRCRCTVVQVNADKYQKSDPEHAQKLGEQATLTPNKNGINTSAIFRFNPATNKIVFPKNHPYSRVKDSDKAISLLKKETKTDNGKMEIRQIKKYDNGGTLSEHTLLKDKKYRDSDFKNVSIVADTFAKHGHQATIMPTIHPKDQKYKEVYHNFIGTKYEGKSPDFMINQKFYEYKSVHSFNENKITKILRNAEKQSSRIIIDKIPVADSEIIKAVKYLNEQKKDIQEVWTYDKENKTVTQVFKKQKH